MSDFYYTYYKKHGNKILMRYKKDGVSKSKVIDFYQPKLYIKTDQPSDTKTIYDENVKPVEFDSMMEAKDFLDQYKDVDNFEVHGNSDYANQFIIELFDGKEPDYSPNDVKVGIIDIEVYAPVFPDPDVCDWPVTAITMYDSQSDQFTTFGLEHENGSYSANDAHSKVLYLNVTYVPFTSEEGLLRSFLEYMAVERFDMTSGWNSEMFDWPYLINRCYLMFGEAYVKKMLSPFGIINRREVRDDFGGKRTKYEVVGMPDLDYLALYKKHTFTPRESFKLDFIAEAELGEHKLDYSDYDGLDNLYIDNYQLYVDYNIVDVDLIRRLNDKLGLFELTYALAYYALTNFSETLGTVKIWEHLIAKHLFNINKVPLSRGIDSVERDFDGAYVMDPIPGMYEWVVSTDLNSLYPHIEMQYNIGPETHVSYEELPEELISLRENHSLEDLVQGKVDTSAVEKYGYAMAANFHFYRKDKMSFFSEIKRDLYNKRKEFKKDMLNYQQKIADVKDPIEKKEYESQEAKANNMQMAAKILLNGGYGALANKHFLYYMVDNAEAITLSGQLINRWTGKRVDEFLNEILGKGTYWIYSDTDSGYYTLKPFVEQTDMGGDIQETVDLIDKFYKDVVGPRVDDIAQELCDYVNGYEQKMVWEREAISERAVWIAKKRYIMTVWDNEGVRYKDKPKLKYMGVEAVRSSTPAWSREYLKECYMTALTEGEEALQELVERISSEFWDFSPDEIAIPRGVNNIEKYMDKDNVYKKGTPMHVKAAIVHNHIVKERGLNINKINSGDKIKFVELKKPNPLREDVVAFEQFLPKEFELAEYVDYDKIFEKAFMSPLKSMLDVMQWSAEETNTLF